MGAPITNLAACRQDPVAGDDQRDRIVGHGLADIARSFRSGAEFLRQGAVSGRAAPSDLPRRGIITWKNLSPFLRNSALQRRPPRPPPAWARPAAPSCILARLKEGFEKRIPSRLLGSPGVTGVDATVAAWDDGQPGLDEILAPLQANRDWLAAAVAAELPGVTMRVPHATYLAWLDCRALELSCPAGQFFLDQAKVGLNFARALARITRGSLG